MTAPAAIVLAAGEGRRMGGPKALLVVDGKPLIARHVERLREAGCRSIVVVVRTAIAREVRAILGEPLETQVTAADTESAAESLAWGLRSLPPSGARPVVVTPVDLLPPRRSTLEALLTTVTDESVRVATPRHRGRGGHPVVVCQSLLQVFLEGARGTLRDVIAASEAHRRRVDVDDPTILGDLDTPMDLASLRPGLTPNFATMGLRGPATAG